MQEKMGDEEQQQQHQQDDNRSRQRAKNKPKSEDALKNQKNGNGNSDNIPRGAFLVVQNGVSKVPDSGYRPKQPLPDLEKGYTLKSKAKDTNNQQQNNDGFCITQQMSPTSYSAIKSPGNSTGTNYYVRIELSDTAGCPKQLKREVAVLQEGSKASPENRKHFLKLVARGRIVDKISPFNYLIVPLCEKSLALPSRQFTHADAFRLSVCCFQAIHDLHALGFVHRNLKPSVFCLRTLQNHGEVRLYLTSFEYAYRFRKREGKESRSPKVLYKMKKAKFLPRSYHVSKEIVRKDDLESWLYILTHLFEPLCLNWQNTSPDMNMLSMKERFFCIDFDVEPFSRLPNGVIAIVRYLHKLDADARPDYQLIGMLLAEICRKEKFPITGPFDFQSNKYADPKAISSGNNPAPATKPRSKALRRNRTADAPAAQDANNNTATASKQRKTRRQRTTPAPPPPTDEDPFDANVHDDQDDDQQQQPPPVQKGRKVSTAVLKDAIMPSPASKQKKKRTKRKRRTQRTRSIQQLEDQNDPAAPGNASTPTTTNTPTTSSPAPAAVTPPLPPQQQQLQPAKSKSKEVPYALLTPAETQDPEEEEEEKVTKPTTQKPDDEAPDGVDGGAAGSGRCGSGGEAGQKDSKKDSEPPIFSANKIPQPKQEDPREEL